MRAAANYAFANRQMMGHRVREAFESVLGQGQEELGMGLVYDVAHNIAKFEKHSVDGRETTLLCAHGRVPPGPSRRGTRSWARPTGIWGSLCSSPGTWGGIPTCFWEPQGAYAETFGSTCHGAGRRMSRRQAKKEARSRNLRDEFEELGIQVRASSFATVAEEIPDAYKDVADVVNVVDRSRDRKESGPAEAHGCVEGMTHETELP